MRVETRQELHGLLTRLLSEVSAAPERYSSLEALSNYSGFSPDHLNRLFRGLLGEPAVQLVRRLMMEQAACQLGKKQMSVSQAAYDAGYSEPEAFAKAFRKAFHMPPATFARCLAPKYKLPSVTGIHWGEDLACVPLMVGAEQHGIRLVVREPLLLYGRLFVGDYREIPGEWQRMRGELGSVEGRTWITVFHDDGIKTVERNKMRSHLSYVNDSKPPLPGFESLKLPAGPFVTSKILSGRQEHRAAWEFLNRHWVPKPGHRLDIPGFDIYEEYPSPWEQLRAQIWLALK